MTEHLTKLQVLVLEDNLEHARLLRRALIDIADVEIATNSKEFMIRLDSEQHYDLFVIDGRINGDPVYRIDEVGFRIIKFLEEKDGSWSRVPIVFTTGADIRPEHRRFLDSLSRVVIFKKPYSDIDYLTNAVLSLTRSYPIPALASPRPDYDYFFVGFTLEYPGDASYDAILHLSVGRDLDKLETDIPPISFNLPGRVNSLDLIVRKATNIYSTTLTNTTIDLDSDTNQVSIALNSLGEDTASPVVARPLDLVLWRADFTLPLNIVVEELGNSRYRRFRLQKYRPVRPKAKVKRLIIEWSNTRSDYPKGIVSAERRVEITHLSMSELALWRSKLIRELEYLESATVGKPPVMQKESFERYAKLIEVGKAAFRKIFRDDEDSIRELFQESQVLSDRPVITITTDEIHFFPWELLYLPLSDTRAERDVEQFWGFWAQIEQILPGKKAIQDSAIGNDSETNVAIVRHTSMHLPSKFEVPSLQAMGSGINVTERIGMGAEGEFKDFLEQPWDIVQLTGHGHRPPDNEIELGDATMAPEWLTNYKVSFLNKPLVILNTCDSVLTEPSPYFNFPRELVDSGARGIIGTQIPMSQYFASRFICKFYEHFFDQADYTISESLYLSRLDCWLRLQSLAGLIYTYFGDSALSTKCKATSARRDICQYCKMSGCGTPES